MTGFNYFLAVFCIIISKTLRFKQSALGTTSTYFSLQLLLELLFAHFSI